MPAVATASGLPNRLGKYELLTPLAAGGMARIYIGRSTGIGSFERHVVLKLITPERSNDTTAVQMFLDEARLAASLNHQNVAQVFEVGEDQGIHYLAMEYVHGQDLRALLAKAGSQGTRIPLELALTVVAGAAAGLHHAHERRGPDGNPLGIVHRDVSPSNIMIGYDGSVKLLDFGIAKATHRSVETQSGIIKGKFAYMAPEQCRGREVDRRSDVFSLGIILYEISTQHRCFRADSDFDTMHRIVTGDVVRPTRLLPNYPQALEAIVMKALAVDPNQRYQSAGQLLEALESFAVSARMAMSTMALGRFMRDMFGEVAEPWLNTSNKSGPVVVKETTVSSTGRADSQPAAAQEISTSDAIPEEGDDGRFPDSAGIAAQTILDLPKRPNDEPQDQPAEWNAKSYPSMQQPSVASNETLPPDAVVRQPQSTTSNSAATVVPGLPRPTPVPQPAVRATSTPPPGTLQNVAPAAMPSLSQPPAGTLPIQNQPIASAAPPPSNAFNPSPGSGTGPAMPVMPPGAGPGGIPSTRHGYASGGANTRGDMSYPRYEAPSDMYTPMVQLRPNRRALYIGIGIGIVGLIAMLAVIFGGGGGGKDDNKNDVPVGSDTPGSGSAPGSAGVNNVVPDNPNGSDDDYISVRVISTPPGADVLIANTKIGTTPFDGKLKRGTKLAQLVVHLEGYTDFTSKIDLSGDYDNDKIHLLHVGETLPNAGSNTPPGGNVPGHDKGTTSPGGTQKGSPGTTQGTKGTTGTPTGTHDKGTTGTTPAHDKGTTGTSGTGTHDKGTGGGTKTGPTTNKPRCQPPGSYNPFDKSCGGQACPPCS